MTHALHNRIGNPEVVHRVGSPDEYVALARQAVVAKGRPADVVRRSGLALPAYVSDGRWVVQCPCGNGPSAHPEWRLAACTTCGLIHEAVVPDNWRAGEEILLAREWPHQRHWFPHDGPARHHRLERAESLLTLGRENRREGRPVRRPPAGEEPAG